MLTGAIQSHNAIGDRSRRKMPGSILQTTRNNARENFKKKSKIYVSNWEKEPIMRAKTVMGIAMVMVKTM